MRLRTGSLPWLAVLLLSATAGVSGRDLLHKHKHHRHHEHHGHHHGWHHDNEQCRTISEVVTGAPNLKRFSEALNHARVPFLDGLFNNPNARATFLAVPDEYLGTGETVFAEATARFLQHTVLDRVKTCKVKDGKTFQTLLGPKLKVVRDTSSLSGRSGRKLADVGGWVGSTAAGSLSTAWGALLDQLPASSASVTTAGSGRAAASSAAAQAAGEKRPHHDHRGPHGHDDEHHGPHGHGEHRHGHHGRRHKHWRHHRHGRHEGRSVESMVEHAFEKAERKAAKHGDLYLELDTTSQRVQVLASVRACEGVVLFVSGFLNPPPDPEPVLAAAQLQLLELALPAHEEHPHHGHHHHHGHHRHHRHHRHGFLHSVNHALEQAFDGLMTLFGRGGPPRRHFHCKHGKHGKHGEHPRRHGDSHGAKDFGTRDGFASSSASFDGLHFKHAINFKTDDAAAVVEQQADRDAVSYLDDAGFAAVDVMKSVPMDLVDIGKSADGMEWFEVVPAQRADPLEADLSVAHAIEATEAVQGAADEEVAQL